MKLTGSLLALSSTLTYTVLGIEAGCYGSGAAWGNVDETRGWAREECYNGGGALNGRWEPLAAKSFCRSGVSFSIQNLNDHEGFNLENYDCYNRLSDIIVGCFHGGSNDVAGWRFK